MYNQNPNFRYKHQKSIMRQEPKSHILWFWIVIVFIFGLGAVRLLFLVSERRIDVFSPTVSNNVNLNNSLPVSLDQKKWIESLRPDDFGFDSFSPNIKWSKDSKYLAIPAFRVSGEDAYQSSTLIVDTQNRVVSVLDGFSPISEFSGAVVILNNEKEQKIIAYDFLQKIERTLLENQSSNYAVISPDGEKVLINVIDGAEISSVLVWLTSLQIQKITKDLAEIGDIWFLDGRQILGFRNKNQTGVEQELSFYGLDENKWQSLDFGIKETRFKKWRWLSAGRTAILTAGFDDSYFLYFVDFDKKTAKLLSSSDNLNDYVEVEETKGIWYSISGQTISIYNLSGSKIKDFVFPTDFNGTLAEVKKDNYGRLIIIRADLSKSEENQKEILIFDPKTESFKSFLISVDWNGPTQIKNDWLVFPANKEIKLFALPF